MPKQWPPYLKPLRGGKDTSPPPEPTQAELPLVSAGQESEGYIVLRSREEFEDLLKAEDTGLGLLRLQSELLLDVRELLMAELSIMSAEEGD